MENASKALIIAGAILLAILIIGLGMLIFNQARDTVSQANLDQETVTAFNSKFDTYIGDNVKGTTVKQLIATVRDNNLSVDASTTYGIKITLKGAVAGTMTEDSTTPDASDATKLNEARNSVSSGKTYKVVASYSSKTKLINGFTITEN